MKFFLLLLTAFSCTFVFSQDVNEKISNKHKELSKIEDSRNKILAELELLKLERIRNRMDGAGLPEIKNNDQLIKHSAMAIGYSPVFKQARWVAHIITPEIIEGVVFRTNDFRTDSTIRSVYIGEDDYFLSSKKPDGTIVYDGFGFDRGHLAPSADFRWSRRALSESYLYSNISPQPPAFNRGIWGDLEDAIRGYIFRNRKSELYVITGPELKEGLPVITRGKNKIPVPEKFWKVVLDLTENKAIGFILPSNAEGSLKKYAVSVDEVEKLTGLDFYNKLPASQQSVFESTSNTAQWLPELHEAETEPLPQERMLPGYFNTTRAKDWINRNEDVWICGTVVSARKSRAGNLLLNLDRPFPNQVFTAFIKEEDLINFPGDPLAAYQGKVVCIKGKVVNLSGTPTIYLNKESQIRIQ